MDNSGQSRSETAPDTVNHVSLVTLADLRVIALDPAILPAASDYAKAWFPRAGTLARAV